MCNKSTPTEGMMCGISALTKANYSQGVKLCFLGFVCRVFHAILLPLGKRERQRRDSLGVSVGRPKKKKLKYGVYVRTLPSKGSWNHSIHIFFQVLMKFPYLRFQENNGSEEKNGEEIRRRQKRLGLWVENPSLWPVSGEMFMSS